jgi:hypothetical protein
MPNFMGGSAPAMASQIGEGFILLSTNSLKGFLPGDLASLRLELDKLLREVRALAPPQDDAQAQQTRNRKITRLSSALQVVQAKVATRN